MSNPVHDELDRPQPAQPYNGMGTPSPSEDDTFVGEGSARNNLTVQTSRDSGDIDLRRPSPSRTREESHRLEDDIALLEAEQVASNKELNRDDADGRNSLSMHRSRSRRSEPVDEFDAATNPLHEKAAAYTGLDNPTTSFAKFIKKVHESSFLIRYLTYIAPLALLLLIPLLVGLLVFPDANVGGVRLLWFSVWLEIFWLTLWGGRIVAKGIPWPLGLIMSIFTNNAKKWRDLGKQLELPATLFFWWLGVEISFLPTMKNHHIDGNTATRSWESTVNKVIISLFVGVTLNFIEKIIIQLIAISFHLRTYADRIEINKFQIGSLTKLYTYSKEKITMEDEEFAQDQKSGENSGTRTPMQYADKATKVARGVVSKVGDVAGAVAGDFTGRAVNNSSHPQQVVLTLLGSTSGSQVLARRLYRTFVRDGFETVFSGDLKMAFDNNDEADAAFSMFDKDMNGDISMEELESVCVEIGRERKSITASLKDLDSVVSKLDDVLFFFVVVVTILVLISLISASTAGVLASAGSAVLALSWLFSATAQEFLQSIIFVFVKHPFDVGDRVSIYGNTGATGLGDDYFVKEIALLYTEFKKMEGHVVQAPNSYLNTLFILNQRRSGGLAEAVPVIIKFGTTLDQIDQLRQRLLEFVRTEKREYQPNILTELREVNEAYSIKLNVVFFYKSNWQNELLRLQRRNKFICMLMITIQEIGIEGPRMNLQGANVAFPYHIAYAGNPPPYGQGNQDPPATPANPEVGHTGSPGPGGLRSQTSILRNRTQTNAARARGASLSTHKHVDFSLGMRDMSSGDMLQDLYEDQRPSRMDVIRSTNRENAERQIHENQSRSSEHSDRRTSEEPMARGGLERPSGESSRPSLASSIHHNRFFGRSRERAPTDMEQGAYGRVDPRSGSVSHQAVHD